MHSHFASPAKHDCFGSKLLRDCSSESGEESFQNYSRKLDLFGCSFLEKLVGHIANCQYARTRVVEAVLGMLEEEPMAPKVPCHCSRP